MSQSEPKSLRLFHDARQVANGNPSFSKSAGKAKALLELLASERIPVDIQSFLPLTSEEIAQVHDPEYVRGVLDCRVRNGFGNTSNTVARSLPFTTGSFVAASLDAFTSRMNAASFTSGFHHAHYSKGGGFCTFNALVLACVFLKKRGARRIGILDLDMHFGDGTESLIHQLELRDVLHYSFGSEVSEPHEGKAWLRDLDQTLEKFQRCEVILFQAGADPYIRDPLGGVLTLEELEERDRRVFRFFKKAGIPVAWNLAGGYTEPFSEVLEIHRNTVVASLEEG